MNNLLKALLFILMLCAFVLGLVLFISSEDKIDFVKNSAETLLGANLPDRCEFFDQVASRSVKDNVKAAGGNLFSYRVVSTGTNLRYFRIHDLATVPTTGATVEYAVPLDTTTASATPKVI